MAKLTVTWMVNVCSPGATGTDCAAISCSAFDIMKKPKHKAFLSSDNQSSRVRSALKK